MPVSHNQRLEMVQEALRAKAPRLYRQLEQAGKLPEFLKAQEQQMMEAYDSQLFDVIQSMDRDPPKDYLQQVSNLKHALSRLTEQVLANCLSFQDQPITG